MPSTQALEHENRPFAFEDAAQVVTFLRGQHNLQPLDAWELVLRVRTEQPELGTDLDALMRVCEERLEHPRSEPDL